MKFRKRNLTNIKNIFEEKTGVELTPARERKHIPMRKALVLAAVIALGLMLVGFTYPLFSPLNGDELSLSATYEGNGVVTIHVENGSDKDLEFQKETRLMRWATSEEVASTGGKVRFENTKFPAHSGGTMTVDLSEAYDMEAVEAADGRNADWYYLVLTNNEFLFGHDWMCSITFRDSEQKETEAAKPAMEASAEHLEDIEEELRFYFEKAYAGEPIAMNEDNFPYLDKVDEVLTRFPGKVVSSLSTSIMVAGTSKFLDPQPALRDAPEGVIFDESVPAEEQRLLTTTEWTYTDAYGRVVAGAEEKAWVQSVMIPSRQGQTDGGAALPLVFWFVYDADAAADPENYAFLYGQLLSFGEMEPFKVWEDAHYAIYDMTDLIYTDVDEYLNYFLSCRNDVYCDEQVRQRVRHVYEYYRDKENLEVYYLDFNQ